MSDESLPPGWARAKFEDILIDPKSDLVDGPFGSNLRSAEYVESGVPVLKIQNIKADRFVRKHFSYVTKEKAEELSRHSFIPGDLMITKLGDPLGLCCEVPKDFPAGVFVADLMRLRLRTNKVSKRFLLLAINSRVVQSQFKEITKGTTRPRVNLTIVRGLEVPLPPLAEQKRIVAKIEELFSELEAGEESLRVARRQLGVYRQSLLKQAFEGKLTEKWRTQNPAELESSTQLLARIQSARQCLYDQQLKEWGKANGGRERPKAPTAVAPIPEKWLALLPDLPPGWVWQTIENLVEHGRSCAYGVLIPGPHVEGGVPLVRVGDIQNGRVDTSEMKNISPKIAGQYRRTELRGGELLISLVGAIGRTAVAQPELRGANTARAVGVVPLSKAINPHFVEVCFRSPAKLAKMVSQANEVARKTLNLENVRKATVPLCSLAEQQEIVRLLDAQFEVIEQNEREIDAALKRSEALRQAILKKAFTGRLVPQDSSDKPASALLARLRIEGATATPRKTAKRRIKPGNTE